MSRVAIIDDDALVQEAFTDCLESAGYSVDCFGSAEEFIASGSIFEHDCLIVDVQLPGITGLELQQRLNETSKCPPIIFVTAHQTEANREQALRHGATAFLSKPVGIAELLSAIRAGMAR